MSDIVVAVLTVAAGLVLCLRGCAAMRVAVPAAAAVGAFLLGAAVVHGITGSALLGDVASWLTGIATGALVGLASWMWFEVAVAVALTCVGYAVTVATLTALGSDWSGWSVVVGSAVGLTLGVLCVVADLPTFLLTVLTSLAGSATALTGVVLLGQSIGVTDLTSGATLGRIPARGAWAVAWLLLSLVGVVVQARTTPRVTLRDRFVDAGGRQLRET